MPAQVLISVLVVVVVIGISIAIAWIEYRFQEKLKNTTSDGSPPVSPGVLSRLRTRVRSWFRRPISSAIPRNDIEQSYRLFGGKALHTTKVHIQIELAEGDRVRVVVEGLPPGELITTQADKTREDDPVVRGLEVGEVPMMPIPAPEVTILAWEMSPTTQPQPVGQLTPEEIQAERLDDLPAAKSDQTSRAVVSETLSQVEKSEINQQSLAIQAALITAAILLALLPPTLVFLDRWKAVSLSNDTLGKYWNTVNFFRQLVYPAYFLYIFAALVVVFVLVWSVKSTRPDFVKPKPVIDNSASGVCPAKRQRLSSTTMLWAGGLLVVLAFLAQVALKQVLGWLYLLGMLLFFLGWLLRVVALGGIRQAVLRNWQPAVAFLTFHIFLLLSLSSYYSDRHGLWVWVAFLAVSLAFTLYKYRRRIPLVLWVMSLALVLYTIRINGWEFSVIGDEYSFFMYAQELAKQHGWLFSINKLFNGVAVFGSHPFFSSFLQMISVRLFPGTDFGWRFSSLYLSAIALVFFYSFFHTFVKQRTALLAAVFLAVSQYIMTFGKIGYNNLQSYFVLSLVMAAGAWAIRTRSLIAYIALGISMGTCFYVYPAALYALPIAFLILLFYAPPFSRPALIRWGSTFLSLGILILPLVLQKDYWSSKIPGTVLYTPEIVSSAGSLASHFVTNLLYAFLSFLYIPQESHFVVSSYVDPLNGALILLGLAYLLIKGLKARFIVFFLVGFATMLFFVGASHGGAYPPNTRMFLLLPWFAMLAAAGLEWLGSHLSQLANRQVWLGSGLGIILVGVLVLNVYQAYSLSKQRSTGLQSPAMLFMRLMERIQSQEKTSQAPLTIWFLTMPPWGIDGYRLFLTTYDIPDSLVRLEKADVPGGQLPGGIDAQVQDPNTLVIIYPDIEPGIQEALGQTLTGLGKQSCPVKTVNDYTRFLLWYSAPAAWVCELGN